MYDSSFATRTPGPGVQLLPSALPNNRSEDFLRSSGALPTRPLLGFGRGSSPENQPMRAQNVAGAQLAADRNPNPPDVPVNLPGESRASQHAVDKVGGNVRIEWFARGLTLCKKICQAHCRSATKGLASHNLLCFAILSSIFVENVMIAADWSPQHGDAFWLPHPCPCLCNVVRLDACPAIRICFFQHLVQRVQRVLVRRASTHRRENTTVRHSPDVLPVRLGCLLQTRVALGCFPCSPPSACVTMRRSPSSSHRRGRLVRVVFRIGVPILPFSAEVKGRNGNAVGFPEERPTKPPLSGASLRRVQWHTSLIVMGTDLALTGSGQKRRCSSSRRSVVRTPRCPLTTAISCPSGLQTVLPGRLLARFQIRVLPACNWIAHSPTSGP